MAIYNTGAVTVKVGSSEIIGSGTSFVSNVAVGYYFKLSSNSAWYEVATVNSATRLQLSTRYADSTNQTVRNPENQASVIAATTIYSGTVTYYPIIQNYFTLTASLEKFHDDGGGVLTGDGTPAGSGTIDYDTGAWAIVLGTHITATANLAASYVSGNTLNAMPYQIVVDYTSNRDYPELSIGDVNFHNVYTKAIRLIDTDVYNLNASISHNTASIDALQALITTSYVKVGSVYLFSSQVPTNTSASILAAAKTVVSPVPKGSVYYNASPAQIWSFTATVTATKVT